MSAPLGGWGELGAAWAAFFVLHLAPARPSLRRRLVATLGERAHLIIYSAVSLATLAWLIGAAGRAPFVLLWAWAPWQAWVPNLIMPLVCLLIAFGVAVPNPLSFGGRDNADFDPNRPGIAGLARHPLLAAAALWAGAHLLVNGDLAHALLFGPLALLAIAGMVIIDRRRRRELGAAEWSRLARRTSLSSGAALVGGASRLALPGSSALARFGAAALLYVSLLVAHPLVFGVSPLPHG